MVSKKIDPEKIYWKPLVTIRSMEFFLSDSTIFLQPHQVQRFLSLHFMKVGQLVFVLEHQIPFQYLFAYLFLSSLYSITCPQHFEYSC